MERKAVDQGNCWWQVCATHSDFWHAAFMYRFWYRAHGAKALRDMLVFVESSVRASYFGMIEAADDTRRKQWLNEIKVLGLKEIR